MEESAQITRFTDARPFLEAEMCYDLVFMDIELPGLNGMEAARQLRRKDRQAKLIFVTNMAQYAVEGYQVDALDFTVKPVTYADFSFKMKRALLAIEMSRPQWLVIQQSTGLTRISSGELLYVEVPGHTLTYHLERGSLSKQGGLWPMRSSYCVSATFCAATTATWSTRRRYDGYGGISSTRAGTSCSISACCFQWPYKRRRQKAVSDRLQNC